MKSGHWTGVRDTCYLRTAWPALVLLGNGCRLAGFTAFFRPWSAAVLAFLGLWVPSEAPRAFGEDAGAVGLGNAGCLHAAAYPGVGQCGRTSSSEQELLLCCTQLATGSLPFLASRKAESALFVLFEVLVVFYQD